MFYKGKMELDKTEVKIKKTKAAAKYISLCAISTILYFVLISTVNWSKNGGISLLVYSIFLAIILFVFSFDYMNKLSEYKIEEKNIYTLDKHVKKNGKAIDGKVVHIKETRHCFYHDDEEVVITLRELVINFEEDGESKYIVKYGFPHEVNLLNPDKDDMLEMYKDSAENIETFKEKCINIYQYIDQDCISFTDLTGESKMYNYADSIEKNYEGEYTCKIYSYKGRYVIGDIEGYDYEGEKIKKQKIANEEKIQKRKEGIIYIIILVLLFILSNGF